MGLIQAAVSSAKGVLKDQYKEFIYCDAIPADVLAVRAKKRTARGSSNNGSDNIITNGSVVTVADGQFMLIVDNGKVVEYCGEPGEFVFDSSTEASLLSGPLSGAKIGAVFAQVGKRITFGGDSAKDMRVYYINTKEIIGNKYGTPNPVPFRVVDQRAGIDIDVSIRCFGEYSYRITNPLLFYANICGNVTAAYSRTSIDGQLKSELLTYLQPAFAQISDMGIRYSSLPGHTVEIADALNNVMSAKWRDRAGIEIVSFGVSSVKASEEDEAMLKELQRNAAFMDPSRAAAYAVTSQADAMKAAAANPNGAAMGFMGFNMAAGAGGGINAASLYQMGAQQAAAQQAAAQAAAPAAPAADGWTCPSCGKTATGKFCPECGTKKPEPAAAATWTCSCGAVNTGKFCSECGAKKPAAECPNCGWKPADGAMPKFCPECGSKLG